MARTLLRVFLLTLSVASAGFAQQAPAWEFFGGYSLERSVVREYYKSTPIIYTFRERYVNLNGWEASLTENVNHWFGGTLQTTGHYKSPVFSGTKSRQQMFTLLYGPRLSKRMGGATVFGHVLFGASRVSVTVSPGPHDSQTSFAVAGGGGLDLNIASRVAVRVLQLQYSPMNPIATKNHKFQASAGIVLNVGKTK